MEWMWPTAARTGVLRPAKTIRVSSRSCRGLRRCRANQKLIKRRHFDQYLRTAHSLQRISERGRYVWPSEAEFFEHAAEVGGPGAFDIDGCAGDGVLEDQAVGVEGEAWGEVDEAGRGVEVVADDGAADVGEVDADLVEPSGEGSAFEQRAQFVVLERAEGGAGFFATAADSCQFHGRLLRILPGGLGGEAALDAWVALVLSDARLDFSFEGLRGAARDGPVELGDLARLEGDA